MKTQKHKNSVVSSHVSKLFNSAIYIKRSNNRYNI